MVNGGKIFITNAGEAGVLSFTAQVIDSGNNIGIAAFIKPTDTQGLEIGKKEKKMGWRASDTRQIYFKDMKIPSTAMLGKPENGFKTFLKTLTSGRISIGALSVGTALGAYEKALKYSIERSAFNKPIHELQSIGFKLADMATEIEASELLIYNAADKKNRGERMTLEGAMAKYYSSEVAVKVATDAVQVLGGYGYTKDFPVERFYRDSKLCTIGEGTSEIQKLVIAKQIIG